MCIRPANKIHRTTERRSRKGKETKERRRKSVIYSTHRPKTQLMQEKIMGTSGNTDVEVNQEATDNWKTRKDARSTKGLRAWTRDERRRTK